MSSLAFDKQAKPFTFHKRTKLLRVRLFRNPRARGTCSQVLDDDGEPLYIDVDTDYPEFRQIIGSVPGLYRLDQCDDDGNEIGDEPAAYVTIDPPRNAQPRDAMSTDVNPLTIIREMAEIQGEALKALSQHQAHILASAADIMRAPYRPAPPPMPAEPRNASDNEDDVDDDMDDELEDDDDDEVEEPAPRGVLDQLAAFAQRFGLTDMKQVHKFAHWAMSKLIEFRRETADAKPETTRRTRAGSSSTWQRTRRTQTPWSTAGPTRILRRSLSRAGPIRHHQQRRRRKDRDRSEPWPDTSTSIVDPRRR